MDVVNLKISKLGGLTKLRQARDLCVSLGIAMTIEDSWGGDITTAAIAHLAHSTPPEFLFTATDFNSYVTVEHGRRRPAAAATAGWPPRRAPGLGVTPKMDVLGRPKVDRRSLNNRPRSANAPERNLGPWPDASSRAEGTARSGD